MFRVSAHGVVIPVILQATVALAALVRPRHSLQQAPEDSPVCSLSVAQIYFGSLRKITAIITSPTARGSGNACKFIALYILSPSPIFIAIQADVLGERVSKLDTFE
ncbi:hypothetical protein CA952_21315 [Raoultella ornithinolytica]|nr:hypothetical protein RORB6_13240 [Raoultella ornithinolytica B6]ASI57308.1 hypothetical protein CA210_03175 [Raoultella ornithinolytica]ATM22507.1 hypothetical protein CRN13_19870 [Raoultella ornithinolytica]OZV26560.1 hypothetical protein CA952_21315 [Raoultella ornithinolytica]OZV38428.1 hypothetical protein CA954_02460 [Raoultella ornithinolytica]